MHSKDSQRSRQINLKQVQRHHTITVGSVTDFFDGHAALICYGCRSFILEYFKYELTLPGLTKLYPIGTGASGMAIISMLGYGSYITPIDKPGPEIREDWLVHLNRERIALVDDCITKGWTMDFMTSILAKQGIVPVKEIVLMGGRPNESSNPSRPAGNESIMAVS